MKNYTFIDKYGNGCFITTAATKREAEKYVKECLKDNASGWVLETVERI